ncbi:glycosyltransferase [Flaviaesturariibacter amylovorans]|uniref:Glycosyltransferase n=1 Tax=Flaviaesturariibacter amylovorans TaxID=1084520 RepID=A0ABP8HPR5_9BACT
MILLTVAFCLWLAYAALIAFYRRGWQRSPEATAMAPAAGIPVTVLVPARNEAERLPALLAALSAQQYDRGLFSVLVLDDHSTDNTAAVARNAGGNVSVLSLDAAAQGKKRAIEAGVKAAAGSLIVTTDADCVPGPHWLPLLVAQHTAGYSAFIAAPVRYRDPQTVSSIFQALDFMTLQGITAASVSTGVHSMCNGANLAYTKEAFEAVDGYRGVDRLASGDDLFLMHKIALRYPGRVHYLRHRDAIVDTDAAPGWRAFWKQRVRWASKSAHYTDRRITAALALVYFFNLWFLVLAIAGFWNTDNWTGTLVLLLLKTVVELWFLAPVARFFGQQHLLQWFPLLQPLHIIYTVAVGALSSFGTYEWKGRRVK